MSSERQVVDDVERIVGLDVLEAIRYLNILMELEVATGTKITREKIHKYQLFLDHIEKKIRFDRAGGKV